MAIYLEHFWLKCFRNILLIVLILGLYNELNVSCFRYDGFSFIEIDTQRYEDIELLKDFSKEYSNDENSFQFVRPPFQPMRKVSVIASPSAKTKLFKVLDDSGIAYTVNITDYQRLIDREFAENRRAVFRSFFRLGGNSDHTAYLRYGQIEDWLKAKVEDVSYAEFLKFGETYEKRQLFMVKISKNSSLPIVWMDGGIHAREWVAVSTPLYVIDKLLSNSTRSIELLNKFQVWIVPLVNPDGYEYSHETHRLWRKNRKRYSFTNCVGVDLNRNYPYEWGSASSNPCVDQYHGPHAASETEIQAIISQMTSIKDKLKLTLSLHAFGQFILQPFSYSNTGYPENYLDMTEVAIETALVLQQKHNAFYLVGRPPDILYAASGSSDDFTVGSLKIPFSFTIELPDNGIYGFALPPIYIKAVGEQIWDGFGSLIDEVYKKLY